jgi:outer membrane protein assembly factor BamA
MTDRFFDNKKIAAYPLLIGLIALSVSCGSTKHLGDNQYLLQKNTVIIRSEKSVTSKGERKDILGKLIVQKPNTNAFDILPFNTPLKLWRYNHRYKKLHDLPDSLLPKSVERPVILDTSIVSRTVQNMKSYLFNQGYFYARIKDTFTYSHKKAFARYIITIGNNYLINKVNLLIDDSNVNRLVTNSMNSTALQKGKEFTYSLTDDERSRLTNLIRNNGYFKFSQENITFQIDTFDKTLFKDVESPFESAVNFIATGKVNKRQRIDIDVIIKLAEDTAAFRKYTVRSVTVYPDYKTLADLRDTTLIKKTIDGIDFKYHDDYVRAKVLFQHMYLSPGSLYSQADYNKTYSKLNELGIFQYIRIDPREDRKALNTLDYTVYLNRTKKYDFVPNTEVSSGSTYALGLSGGVNFRDRNFMHGANLLTIGVSGGVELSYNDNVGQNIPNHFSLLTKYYGANASIDFPKFLAPIASSLFDNSNLPHTIVGGGENVLVRVNYFTLVNTSVNFSYSWHQTQTITWTFSPAFINLIQLPKETDSFKKVLSTNDYLKNSYKEDFIEGENISFTYDNIVKKHGSNYSFLKLSIEEAGGLLGAVNQLGVALNDLYQIPFAQYTKFDFDGRHYFTLPHSVFAMRFYGGVGIPYGQSTALPYIKQYFAGGPYSLRGWRIRTLGPGSYYDANNINNPNQIDRTGDIKLEFNTEYRFPITPLFAGAVKMNGALFFDAGNIWLARADTSFHGGEFQVNTLAQDLAADIGAGTRFDIASFLTLRVDVAIPVKKPYSLDNGGWVFNQIDFYNSTWRANNIIFNISIGYPF